MEEETWEDLSFWQSGEWQAVQDNLTELEEKGFKICPAREDMFAALDLTPLSKVKVMFCGQDPYPNPDFATGLAFSIPYNELKRPPTLLNILQEYINDLFITSDEKQSNPSIPQHGSLEPWGYNGVLLWNVIPTCTAGVSMSHYPGAPGAMGKWSEWQLLTKEIIAKVNERGLPFVFMGGVAREFVQFVNQDLSTVIETSHPSPRGVRKSQNPFLGSRIFSRVNEDLVKRGLDPIDWRLE